MKFNENLRNFRRDKDYSQEYLAEKMAVSRQTISKWENGTAMPDLKKLTELAELFGVSMDELLGTSVEAPARDRVEADEDYKVYISSLVDAMNANNQQIYDKKNKKSTTILSLSVIILAIALIITNVNMSSNIGNLQNQVNVLSSLVSNSQQDNYNEEDEDVCSSYEVLSINSEKPYLATVRFTYEPKSYDKNTTVFFLVPERNGEGRKIPAENVDGNGVFVATSEIDVTAKGDFYTLITGNDKIDKESFENRVIQEYTESDCEPYSIDLSIIDGKSKATLSLPFEAKNKIKINSTGDVKNVHIGVMLNGRELCLKSVNYNKISNDEYSISINTPPSFTFDVPESIAQDITDIRIYYYVEMDNGYSIRVRIPFFANGDLAEGGDDGTEYIFNIDGEEVSCFGEW